jgi:hypothetical protein
MSETQENENKLLNVLSKIFFGFLTFCLAIFGYILWFALKKHYPEQAKSCLFGSTIGTAMMILAVGLAFVLPDDATDNTEGEKIVKTEETRTAQEIRQQTTREERSGAEKNKMNTVTPATGSFMPLVLLGETAVQIFGEKENDEEGNIAGLIILCIVIYIIALLFSKKSSCIIVYGWKDFALLASPLVIITFIILYNTFYGQDNGKIIEANNILANIIFVLPIITTFAVSVVANTRHSSMPYAVFFTIISIAGKIVLMIVMVVFLILCIGILGAYQEKGRKKDGRYKSGYRPGKSNIVFVAIAMAILGFLATFFIKSLVKNPDGIGDSTYDEDEDDEDDEDEYEDEE